MRRRNEPHPDNPFRKGDRVRMKPAHVPAARPGRPRSGPWTGTVATQPRTAALVSITWDGTKWVDVRHVEKVEKVENLKKVKKVERIKKVETRPRGKAGRRGGARA